MKDNYKEFKGYIIEHEKQMAELASELLDIFIDKHTNKLMAYLVICSIKEAMEQEMLSTIDKLKNELDKKEN